MIADKELAELHPRPIVKLGFGIPFSPSRPRDSRLAAFDMSPFHRDFNTPSL